MTVKLFALLWTTLAACPTEDSDNCKWNGATMGNGHGLSFIAYQGNVYYADDWF